MKNYRIVCWELVNGDLERYEYTIFGRKRDAKREIQSIYKNERLQVVAAHYEVIDDEN